MESIGFSETMQYFKHDGSVDPGFELVLHPMTRGFFESSQNPFWNSLAIISEYPEVVESNWKCPQSGLHLHMSRGMFTKLQLYKFMQFVYQNEAVVSLISGRPPNSEYCHYDLDESSLPHSVLRGRVGDRYRIINLENTHTIEMRGFKSSTDPDSILRYVEFCCALWAYSMDISIQDYDARRFLEWVTPKQYPKLYQFIKENYDSLMSAAIEGGKRTLIRKRRDVGLSASGPIQEWHTLAIQAMTPSSPRSVEEYLASPDNSFNYTVGEER
jgi:hypothetical protein